MQFTWTTFFIEMINFIILVWILKRLLYMPIKKAIEARRQLIQNTLDEASKRKQDAVALENQYENRLNDWEKEKDDNKKQLYQEMTELKRKEMNKLQASLAKEKDKQAAIQQHQLKDEMEHIVNEAMGLATDFLAKLMKQFADAELENKIVIIFLNDLSKISEAQLQSLQSELHNESSIHIQSAFPLNEEQRNSINDHLKKLFSKTIQLDFSQQEDLLAGLNIQIGSIHLRANLRDGLKYFGEVSCGSLLV